MSATSFNTRISLKYDTYTNWTNNNPVLLVGEVAVAVVPASSGAVTQEPAVLFKVGDGTSRFNALSFVSGLAADVYDWAKAANKPTYSASEIDGLAEFVSGEIQDTNTTYKIEVAADNPRKFTLYAKEINGNFVAQNTITIPAETVYTLAEGTVNGTVKFNGTDVAVHGLKSAAYSEASAFTVSCDTATNVTGVAKRYTIKQGGTDVVSIDIPKDMVVSSGTVETKTESGAWGAAGTYLHLVLANATDDDIYINVSSLIEYITVDTANNTGIVQLAISADHKISASVKAHSITANELAESINAAIGKAHEHNNKNVLDNIAAADIDNWNNKADGDHNHNIESLTQGVGYIIFNCGSATVNI